MKITLVNGESGEVVEREMTAEEQSQHEATIADDLAIKIEAEEKAAQRQAILQKLGLTEEEATLLLS